MNTLLRLASLGTVLLVVSSCQTDDRGGTAPTPSSTAVAFRLADDATPLIRPDIVALKVWADDTELVLDRRFDWSSGQAEIQVPLHRPLRFELRGIRLRDNRDLLLWTGFARDTLDDLSAEVALVTMNISRVDTTAPNIFGAVTSQGTSLISSTGSPGVLFLSLPAGGDSGAVSIPDSLADSLFVHGQCLTSVDGAWVLRMGLGDTATIQLVGGNGAVATWALAATSRDDAPLDLAIAVDNGAKRTSKGDTILFELPYVVDSAIHLTFTLRDASDRADSIALDGRPLDASKESWTTSPAVPVAGEGKGSLHRIVTRDSVGNVGIAFVRIDRSTSVRAPALAWATAPGPESLGVHDARFVLRVIGGDSVNAPVFLSKGLASASTDQTPLRRAGDTVWWNGSIPLQESDAGGVVALVGNRLDATWSLDTAWITRFDPRGPDKTAPSATADAKTLWTRSSSVVVSGQARDERGGKVVVTVSHSGRTDTASWSASDNSWSWTMDWSGDGDTTLSIVAYDSAGNASPAATVRVVRDTKAPVLAWASSSGVEHDSLVVGSLSATVTVNASDDGHLSGVYVFREGSKDTLPLGSLGEQWGRTLAFQSGWSLWTFGAIDSSGNRRELVLRVLAGDTTGVSMTISVNNGASLRRSGDTLVFTLPYVVDSALAATLSATPASDRPSSIKWGAQDVAVGEASSWRIPLTVPSAGPAGSVTTRAAFLDSLDNASAWNVRIVRDTNAAAPVVAWATAPADKPWGSFVDSFVVLVLGGDSLKTPTFASDEYGSAVSAASLLRRSGDSSFWGGTVSLLNRDSGAIVARVENLLGRVWTSNAGFVHRFDPDGPDLVPPSFTVDTLPANGWTSASSVVLRGTAHDARSSGTTVLVKRASGAIDTASWSADDKSWSAIVHLAADVDTTVSVYAVDTAGNATLPVAIRVRRDRGRPGFDWGSPPAIARDTLRTSRTESPLRVNSGAADLARVWAVRGGSADTLPFRKDSLAAWSATVSLPQGWTTWTIGATDSAGNDSLRVLRVLRDTIAPTVAWEVSGSIAEGKYAIASGRDTIWLSSDTTLTLSLSSTTGFAGVSVPSPNADSAGETRVALSSLALRQAAGSSTTWTFQVADELGNASAASKLVVVGVEPVAQPVAKAGSSVVALAAGAVLPWPKTVHYSCPDAGASLLGIKADSLIHKTVSMAGSCKLGKLRSSLRTFGWSIADTGSLSVRYGARDSSKVALAVDASGRLSMATGSPWYATGYPSAANVYRTSLSPDTGNWNDDGSQIFLAPTKVLTARGSDVSGRRYHVVLDTGDGQKTVSWMAAGSSAGKQSALFQGSPDVGGIYVQGEIIQYAVNTRTSLARTYLSSGAPEDTLIPSGMMKEFRHCATRTSSAFVFFGIGAYVPFGLWSPSGQSYVFPYTSAGPEFASTPNSDSFFIVARDRNNSSVHAYKFSSPTATAPSYSTATLANATVTRTSLIATWNGDDLWMVPGATTLYRISNDLSTYETFELPGTILGHPEPDPTGGVWVLVATGSSTRVYHVKGSRQE